MVARSNGMIKQEAIHWSDQVICRLELPCCADAWQKERSNTTCREYTEMAVARGICLGDYELEEMHLYLFQPALCITHLPFFGKIWQIQ